MSLLMNTVKPFIFLYKSWVHLHFERHVHLKRFDKRSTQSEERFRGFRRTDKNCIKWERKCFFLCMFCPHVNVSPLFDKLFNSLICEVGWSIHRFGMWVKSAVDHSNHVNLGKLPWDHKLNEIKEQFTSKWALCHLFLTLMTFHFLCETQVVRQNVPDGLFQHNESISDLFDFKTILSSYPWHIRTQPYEWT